MQLDDDSITYIISLASSEFKHGHYSNAIEILQKGYSIDSLNTVILSWLGAGYMLNDQIEKSLEYTKKYIERKRALEQFTPSNTNTFMVGYYYWQKGDNEKAKYYFDEEIKKRKEIIRTGNIYYIDEAYIFLAAVHSFRGEENQAFEYLRLLNQRHRIPIQYSIYLKNIPLFNSLRNKPEFQQILQDVEAKYQAEHERVRLWLEENDML